MKYRIIRYWNGSKGYGSKRFDTIEDAREFLRTDEKTQEDKMDGFTFSVEEVQEWQKNKQLSIYRAYLTNGNALIKNTNN